MSGGQQRLIGRQRQIMLIASMFEVPRYWIGQALQFTPCSGIPNQADAGNAEQTLAVAAEVEMVNERHIRIGGGRQQLTRRRIPQTNDAAGRGRRQYLAVG